MDTENRPLLDPNVVRAGAPRVSLSTRPVYGVDSEHSFVRDAITRSGNLAAAERIGLSEAYEMENGVQRRDITTGAFTGLTVPQYLVDLFAPYARAGAPFRQAIEDAGMVLPLPQYGMTVNIGRGTTGTSVTEQASEGTGVSETDYDDTLLTVNVCTYAGQQDISRQVFERSENADTVILADLLSAYYTKLDTALLSGSGNSGQHKGLDSASGTNSESYTDGTPTQAELYPKLFEAASKVATARFLPASHVILHGRRAAWLAAGLSTSFPLFGNGFQAGGQAMGVATDLSGLKFVQDSNITTSNGASTNEDKIYVVRVPDLMLWQEGDGSPRTFTFEQIPAAPEKIRLAVWGYSAFTAERYATAVTIVTGTGLVTPVF
jgi:hypothetical protein